MPLHISEIGVRMAVLDPGGGPEADSDEASAPPSAGLTAAQRDAIVEDCARAVLRTMRMTEAR